MKILHTRFFNFIILTTLSVIFASVALLPLTSLAFFSDTEEATEQTFRASELLFKTSLDNQEMYVGPGLATEHTFAVPIAFSSSSIDSKYAFKVLGTTGDATFCGALALKTEAGAGGAIGPFSSFTSGDFALPADIDMTVYYDITKRNIVHNASCTAEIEVMAWQSNMPKETAGYRDRVKFSVTVIAHMVVLNEVLANPNTVSTEGPRVEFIELYNNSDFDVNVFGWNITELTATGLPISHFISNVSTAPAIALVAYDNSLTTVVPARGFLALKYKNSVNNNLGDDGDTITLIDGSTSAAIDSYRYTVTLVGKSDARIPDGIGAWIDPIPTPDSENIAEDPLLLLATSTATGSIFTELLLLETSTPTDEEFAAASSSATENNASLVVADEDEDIISSSNDVADVVKEDLEVIEKASETIPELAAEIEAVVVDSNVEEKKTELPPVEPLPLTDANTAAEDLLLNPEPMAKTNEEEVEITEVIVVTPDET